MITVGLQFNGNIDSNGTLTFTVGADAIAGYNGDALTATLPVTALTESVTASTATPLTEATLNGSIVTLTLNNGVYEIWNRVRNNLTVSGITGVRFISSQDVVRVSDTKVTISLRFNGNIDTDATLTFTVGADAIANYNGSALTAQVSVTALTESVTASTATPLTEATLNGSIVTLTLNNGVYESWNPVRNNLTVSGITGVRFISSQDVVRVSDTKVTISLRFNGNNIDTDATLTFTVGAAAIEGYSGDALTATLLVTALPNRAPVFSGGASTTRTVAENTGAGVNIGSAVSATDADNDTLTYTLSGTDATSFDIVSTSGQLQTKATLDYETKTSYTVTVTVSDGSLADSLTVTINVTDLINEQPATYAVGEEVTTLPPGSWLPDRVVGTSFSLVGGNLVVEFDNGGQLEKDGMTYTCVANGGCKIEGRSVTKGTIQATSGTGPINRAPVFTAGASTTRTVAEDTGAGVNIGSAVSATDVDNDTLTYTLSGTDAASFDIVSTSGQLRTKSALDYKTTPYTVTVTVSDGSLTDSITVSITVTEVTEETVSASTPTSLTEATVDESVVTLTLTGGTYEQSIGTIRNNVTVSGIAGVTARSSDVRRVSDTVVRVELTFDGTDFDTDATLTFTVGAAAVADYTGVALTAQVPVTALEETVTTSTPAPLTEVTLDESVVTLTLSGRVYGSRSTVENNVTVSGIDGVTIGTDGIDRESDTAITVQLEFDGDLVADAHLTFTVGAGAIANYNGSALTAILPVTTVEENSITVSLQKVGADQFKAIASSSTPFDIVLPLSVTNGHITGGATTVTIPTGSVESELLTVTRTPGTSDDITVDIGPLPGIPATHPGYSLVKSTDLPLTFITYAETSLMAIRGTITNQDGTPAGAGLQVTVTIGSTTKTATSEVEGAYAVIFLVLQGAVATSEDTVTVEVVNETTGASVEHTGPLSPEQITAKQATIDLQFSTPPQAVSLTASTVAPLTESTLDGSVVTLTLTGGTYESSIVTIRNAVAVSGITGVTVATSDVSRVNDTKVTVELTFNGTDFDTNATLTLTVGAGAIAGYSGPALTASLRVTALTESVVASTVTPLTEATLDGSVVTLTLTDATYESSIVTIRNAVAVSGITGVTVATSDVSRVNDTKVTVELTFNGTDFDTNATLTLTVGAGAIAGYSGPAVTASLRVTALTESVVASTVTPLTESTLDGSVVTLTLTGATYESSIVTIRNAVAVSGITGVTVAPSGVSRVNDTKVTVELTFNGTDFDTNATLTLTVGAGAIAGYSGPALTASLRVTALTESVVASTVTPLTEATLDGSVVTLTLNGATYASSIVTIRNAVAASGITGVTVATGGVSRVSDTVITVPLAFDGTPLAPNATLTFTVAAGAIAGYSGPAVTVPLRVTALTESVVASTVTPLTESTLDGSVVTLTLNGATYASSIVTIRNAVAVSGITGVTVATSDVSRVNDTKVTVELTFNGTDFDTNATLTLTVGAGAIAGYSGPALTASLRVTALTESVVASTVTPLTEATLDGSVVTLTLTGATYESSIVTIRNAVAVSGITGVTVAAGGVSRVSDTVITVPLAFDGTNLAPNATLTLTVGAGAIAGYSGPALTASLRVTALTESVVASTVTPLTEATLDGSVVTLTLTDATYESSIVTIRNAVAVSGITGVTIATGGVSRVSDTVITVPLAFDGTPLAPNATLTFTIAAGAIAGYRGPTLTAPVSVTTGTVETTLMAIKGTITNQDGTPAGAGLQVTVTIGTTIKTAVSEADGTYSVFFFNFQGVAATSGDTVTVSVSNPTGASAEDTIQLSAAQIIAKQAAIDLQFSTPTQAVSVTASTVAPLTESTLNGSVVTLTLTGVIYESSIVTIRNAVAVSGITGVTVATGGVSRVSDTVITVPLAFDGTNLAPNATLTLTVGAGAIAGYRGPALTAPISITTGTVETTLMAIKGTITNQDGTPAGAGLQVTVTIGTTIKTAVSEADGTYSVFFFNFQGVAATSGDTVTVSVSNPTGASTEDTIQLSAVQIIAKQATIDLQFSTPTQAVSVTASTVAPLTEATLDGSVVTLTLAGVIYESSIVTIRNAVAVSGITGVTVAAGGVSRVSDTVITVPLAFDGTNLAPNATLTFTVAAGAIAGYSGVALTASLRVTALTESVVASTGTPLTEATLDGSVVTLTLAGAIYESSIVTIRNAVAVSGIAGVTVATGGVSRVSDTVITVPLAFDGTPLAPNATLTFTIAAGAIAGYRGPALTAPISVTTGTVETTLMAIKGTITNQDGTPAGAGLQVTVTIGTTIKTAVSEADGTYSVFFFNFQGVAATSGDTVTVSVSNPTGASAEDTIQLSAAQIIAKQAAIDLQFPLLDGAVSTPVSVRTPQVRDAIVAAVPGVNSANAVTAVHLAAIHTLSLSSQSIATLKAGDFDGFTALATLTLNNNALSTLPAGIFDKLTALTRLDLNNTNLSTLPSGIFDKLTTLTTLTLNNTNLSTLPAGIFDKLTALTRLDLNNTNLSTLPSGIFDKLTALTTLALNNTNLSTLPAGLFDGLTGLTNLTLHGNAVDPLPLTVSLERVRSNQFKAVAPTGAPFEIVLLLIVANGTIDSGATTITIPKGSVESVPLTITRTVGTTDAMSVDIGAPLPVRPVSHTGYTLVKSDDLPLTLITFAETSLMAIKGTVTYEDGSVAGAGLQVTVTIGSSTQTVDSKADGVYTAIFANFLGVVATSKDTVTVAVLSDTTGASVERTVPLSPEQIVANQATIDLQFSSTPSGTDREYLLSVSAGISLIHVPLKVTAVDGVAQTIESVGDLYDALGGSAAVELLITYDPETQRWNSYLHDGHRGRLGDKALTDDLGIIASMKVAKSVKLSGDALGTNGRSSITLHPGINLFGVPLKDSRITRVSDLLKLNGFAGNVSVIIVSDNGFKVVAQADDPGDIPVTGGGAFILTARNAATVEITGTKWSNPLGQTAAPSTALTGTQTDSVTPILAVTGSISSVGNKSLSRSFRVTVKNRSTGTVDTAMTDDDGVTYQFTFVDIERGRAAQVGDILEITAQSPDPFVGVQPLRHTVTVEDVKRSRIPLAELVAYEIPAKTELLLNYPNPFNPETWIPYRLAKDAFVTLTIYDQRGRVVRDIAVGHRIAAVYESRSKAIYWDGRTEFGERVASGIYFYTLTAGDYSATRKMVILK